MELDDVRKFVRDGHAYGVRGQIIVTYNGSGDSGDFCFEEADPDAETWLKISGVSTDKYSPRSLLEMAATAVCVEHEGWENNDGGYGEVTFDFTTQEITVDHSQAYTEHDQSSHTY